MGDNNVDKVGIKKLQISNLGNGEGGGLCRNVCFV